MASNAQGTFHEVKNLSLFPPPKKNRETKVGRNGGDGNN